MTNKAILLLRICQHPLYKYATAVKIHNWMSTASKSNRMCWQQITGIQKICLNGKFAIIVRGTVDRWTW